MSRPFVPREYQHIVRDYIMENTRAGIWLFMGAGKTASTISALDMLSYVEDDIWPALVLAPLRVARNVWPGEQKKWSDFSHLRVIPIVGDESERKLALRQKAQIYCCNFENLEWLVKTVGQQNWPFKTVIADESTKLKSFRIKQGGKRAKALSLVAWTKVKRFINLTGTPSPNGLKDLWGQTWFLDKGERLGRTHEAFMQRWFQKNWDGYGVDPLPHAQKEIQERLNNLCISLDPADYFDIKEPILTEVYVDLPQEARKLYKQMEEEMFIELENHPIEAFNAGVRTNKCIAENTPVLTQRGWIPIQDIKMGEKVWDGEEWVNVDKSLCNGYKKVIDCWGVKVTPDHKILTKEGWREAQEINGKNSKRYHRPEIRLPDDFMPGGESQTHTFKYISPLAGAMHMWAKNHCKWSVYSKKGQGEKEILRVPPGGDVARSVGNSRDDGPSCVGILESDERTLFKSSKQGLEKLRWPGDKGLCSLAEFFFKFLERHGPDLAQRFNYRTEKQQGQLQQEELPMGNDERAVQQFSPQRIYPNTQREDDNRTGSRSIQDKTSNFTAKGKEQLAAEKVIFSPTKIKVYDLVNCGPRNRFTVLNTDNTLILVHNCAQLANGAAYIDHADPENKSPKDWRIVHDAKLEALEDIIEECAGAPVMVAYEFKSDLARLKKYFPKARVLDAKPQTEDDWNAGKIPLLLAHPASAGHGLNLQCGGNILVFFGHSWNLEYYLQMVERIGPVRQIQSGFNRNVFLYFIMARDTVDEDFKERRLTKKSVQDILLESMKIRRQENGYN